MSPKNNDSIGVYIHYPFCLAKCPYCDFNSFALVKEKRDEIESRYIKALCVDIARLSKEFHLEDKQCHSIFFGGGTPSLMSEDSFVQVLQAISNHFSLSPSIEITLEANPVSLRETVSKNKIQSFISSGLNRVSFGVQSFIPEKLKFLGRWHTPEDTISSVSLVREAGINNVNLDLIYGVKGEKVDTLIKDLCCYHNLNPEHVSAYMLTIEDNTEFGKRTLRGERFVSSDSTLSEMYRLVQNTILDWGFIQYEVSNFSCNEESMCSHNLSYWTGDEYVGVGAGAHGYLHNDSPIRYSCVRSPKKYIEAVESQSSTFEMKESIGEKETVLETLLTGLRLSRGISLEKIDEKMQLRFLKALEESSEWKDYLSKGYLHYSGAYLRIPEKHFVLADTIISDLCSAL